MHAKKRQLRIIDFRPAQGPISWADHLQRIEPDWEPVRLRLEHPDYPHTYFDVFLGEDAFGALAVVGYAVHRTAGATSRLGARQGLRAPFGEIVNHAVEYLIHNIGYEPVASWAVPESIAPLAARLAARPGRRSRALVDYAEIARAYVDALDAPNPVEVVADQFGMARKSVSNALARARERGLLTRTEPGRAGGRLTAKAEKLLEEKEQENRGTR